MIKLYKRVEDTIAYHEAWLNEAEVVEHWGTLGERGHTRRHALDPNASELENLKRVLTPPLADGYVELPEEELRALAIEYRVRDFGTSADAEKQRQLLSWMDEALRGVGLGHCDGGSIGSGSMEVRCLVVDFETARRFVSETLQGSQFADFVNIRDDGDQGDGPGSADYPDDVDGDTLRRIASEGSDMTKPMAIDFAVALPSEPSARQFAVQAEARGYATEVTFDDDDASWTCYCTKSMIAAYDALLDAQDELQALAGPFGGQSDGWGTFGNAPKDPSLPE